MAEKVVIIFIEGDTEEEFYKEMLSHLRQKNGGKFDCKIVLKNIRGVGNYKSKVSRIFEKKIKRDYPGYYYEVILCYDTDVFEFAQKPPIVWNEIISALEIKGANRVKRVLARQSIEDWFLYDLEGLRTYLKLPKKFKITGYAKTKGLQTLFNKANKTYLKGTRCDGLVRALDMEKIFPYICPEISAICEAVGIDCENEKKCSEEKI